MRPHLLQAAKRAHAIQVTALILMLEPAHNVSLVIIVAVAHQYVQTVLVRLIVQVMVCLHAHRAHQTNILQVLVQIHPIYVYLYQQIQNSIS